MARAMLAFAAAQAILLVGCSALVAHPAPHKRDTSLDRTPKHQLPSAEFADVPPAAAPTAAVRSRARPLVGNDSAAQNESAQTSRARPLVVNQSAAQNESAQTSRVRRPNNESAHTSRARPLVGSDSAAQNESAQTSRARPLVGNDSAAQNESAKTSRALPLVGGDPAAQHESAQTSWDFDWSARDGTLSGDNSATCVRGGKKRRVAWLHIPKTGTSLGNMIAHYLRPDLPAAAFVPDCKTADCNHAEAAGQGQIEFQYRYRSEKWFSDCLWLKPGHGPENTDWFAHSQLQDQFWEEFKGDFVALFREPQQRAISSYWSFAAARKNAGIDNQEDWARHIEGTATKMITGQEYPIETQPQIAAVTTVVPDIDLAIKRLDGFRFVGVLEQYPLSVCLFHTITNTSCSKHDLDNMRKNTRRSGKFYDTSELNGYVDPYDTKLYEAVTFRFWSDVKYYELTPTKCHSRCRWLEPETFGIFGKDNPEEEEEE